MQRNIAIGRKYFASNGHCSVDRGKINVISCRDRAIRLHVSVGLQCNITVSIHFIAIRLKFRNNLQPACFVFYRNITIDHRQNGKLQFLRAIQYRNAALDGSILAKALHRNSTELIVLSLQVHVFGAGGGNRLRLDALRQGLGDSLTFRGKQYILICRYICVNRHIVLSGYCNISCHCRYICIDRYRAVRTGKRYVASSLYCTVGSHVASNGSNIHVIARC